MILCSMKGVFDRVAYKTLDRAIGAAAIMFMQCAPSCSLLVGLALHRQESVGREFSLSRARMLRSH